MNLMTSNERAYEFLQLYKHETKQTEQWLEQRLRDVQSGTFELSTEELTYGAKVAWRNSNKCIGRLFWKSLHVFDKRHCLTAEHIFEALLSHIQFAFNGGKIRPAITIFDDTRVRIWNHQLLRYAGYETEQGIIGDPDSVAFTKQAEKLGWQGARTRFDLLPLIIQIDDEAPVWMALPHIDDLIIPIVHPDYDEIANLQLEWYAVPIISDMPLECAGFTFQAAPFNGWYMGTEIGARNLADTNRYNQLRQIAKALGLDTSSKATLWQDRALVELNIAVLHSFKKRGVTIVDHHTAAQQFELFAKQETSEQRDVTGNWVWLIPPLSPATTSIFHKPIANIKKNPTFSYQRKPY